MIDNNADTSMYNPKSLQDLTKEELIRVIEIYQSSNPIKINLTKVRRDIQLKKALHRQSLAELTIRNTEITRDGIWVFLEAHKEFDMAVEMVRFWSELKIN